MTLEQLRLNIKWLESKRWVFNLTVGFFRVFALMIVKQSGFINLTKEEIYLSQKSF